MRTQPSDHSEGVAAARCERLVINTRAAPTATISNSAAMRNALRRLRTGATGASQDGDGAVLTAGGLAR